MDCCRYQNQYRDMLSDNMLRFVQILHLKTRRPWNRTGEIEVVKGPPDGADGGRGTVIDSLVLRIIQYVSLMVTSLMTRSPSLTIIPCQPISLKTRLSKPSTVCLMYDTRYSNIRIQVMGSGED